MSYVRRSFLKTVFSNRCLCLATSQAAYYGALSNKIASYCVDLADLS